MNVFLSSTSVDLAAYRERVEHVIQRFDHVYRGMEYFGSSTKRPLAICLEEVQRSDLLLCIVGTRYGSLTENGKSFTHREVEHAIGRHIPVLAYVLDRTRQPVLAMHMAAGDELGRLEHFTAWLGQHCTITKFTTPDDLGVQVASDLFRFQRDLREVRSDAYQDLVSRLDGTASRPIDVYVVTLHNLDVMYQVDQVAADYETTVGIPMEAPGGSGANTGYALGKLGFRVAASGITADDRAGEALRQDLGETQLDIDDVLVVPARQGRGTGRTTVYTDPMGRRSIYVYPGVNEAFAETIAQRGAMSELTARIRSARVLHLTSFTAGAERRLQEHLLAAVPADTIVSFTPGALYAKLGVDRLSTILSRVNVVHVYEHQLDRMLEDSSVGRGAAGAPLQAKLQRFFQWRVRRGFDQPLVVTIKTSAGTPLDRATIGCGRQTVEEIIPTQGRALALNLPGLVDATGAGDAMAAGVLAGLLGRQTLGDCADLAYVLGGYASSALGARAGLPDRERLRAWLPIDV